MIKVRLSGKTGSYDVASFRRYIKHRSFPPESEFFNEKNGRWESIELIYKSPAYYWPESDWAHRRLQQGKLHDRLRELTPHLYFTPLIVGLNLLAYVLMLFSGLSALSPSIPGLLDWGANTLPYTCGGESWRLFSNSFLHIGFFHLLMNMLVLVFLGRLVERIYGNLPFLLIYLVSGMVGSLTSILMNDVVVSAGASGAIFGLFGAIGSMVTRQYRAVIGDTVKRAATPSLLFLAYSVISGVSNPGIDNAAHFGGLFGGFLCGALLNRDLEAGRRFPLMQSLLVTALAAAAYLGGIHVGAQRIQQDARMLALTPQMTEDRQILSAELNTYLDALLPYIERQDDCLQRLEEEMLQRSLSVEERLRVLELAHAEIHATYAGMQRIVIEYREVVTLHRFMVERTEAIFDLIEANQQYFITIDQRYLDLAKVAGQRMQAKLDAFIVERDRLLDLYFPEP